MLPKINVKKCYLTSAQRL